jgi:uncharacterized protein YdgA (DUF945 family)
VKKTLIFVLILLLVGAALFGVSAYWFGMQAEHQYNAALRQGSQWGYVKFTNEAYKRGFFSSRARTVIEVQEPASAQEEKKESEPFRVTLAQEINHGPLIFEKSADGQSHLKPAMAAIETTVVLKPETRKFLQDTVGKSFDPSTIKAHTSFDFSGGGESRLMVPAFEQTAQAKEGGSVKWEKLEAQLYFTNGFKSFKGSVSAPGIYISDQTAKFVAKSFGSTFDFHEGIDGLLFGDASWGLAKFEYTDENSKDLKHFSLAGLSIKTSTKAAGDNVESSLGIGFDQAMADDAQYGPAILSLELRNLDAASLAKLKQMIRQTHQTSAQQLGQQTDQLAVAKYMEILPGLLKKSPEVELREVSLKSSKGDFQGKAKIAIDGTKSEAAANPFMILNALAIQAEVNITDALLEGIVESKNEQQIADGRAKANEEPCSREDLEALAAAKTREQLDGLVAQHILVHEDGKYKANASYQKGEAKLNGQPLPLQDLLQ